jgi:hypothetical protein
MTPRLIFHIGCPKTGSSSIQASLVGLHNEDWYYISTVRTGNESGPIYTAFKDKPWKNRRHILANHDRTQVEYLAIQTREHYAQLISSSRAYSQLISAEDISGFTETELLHLRDFAYSLNRQPLVVAYLRPVASWLESAFQQRLKSRTYTCLQADSLASAIELQLPSYQSLVSCLHTVFEQNNVSLYAFDPKTFPSHDVVVDFCLRLGVRANYKTFRRVNERVSLLSMKVITLASLQPLSDGGLPDVYRDGPLAQNRGSVVQAIVSEYSSEPKFKISPDLLNQITQGYQADYASLSQYIKSHAPFSLLSLKDHTVDCPQPVSSFDDLCRFTSAERDRLLMTLQSNGLIQITSCSFSDQQLAAKICQLFS